MKKKDKYVIKLVNNLTILLNANIELIDALEIIYKNDKNRYLKQLIYKIKKGNSLRDSFRIINNDKDFLCYIEILDKMGDSKSIFNALKEKYEFETNIKNDILILMIYPLSIFIITFIVLIILLVFIVPKFSEIYKDMNVELPVITNIILDISYTLNNYLLYIFLIFQVMVILIYLLIKKNNAFLEYIGLKNKLLFNYKMLLFTKSMYMMLDADIDILEAIKLSSNTKNRKYNKILKNIYIDIEKGSGLGETIKKAKIFDQEFINIIYIGENSGSLKESFYELHKLYNQKIEKSKKIYLKLIEPSSLISIALIIAFIVFSIMLPLFNLDTLIDY